MFRYLIIVLISFGSASAGNVHYGGLGLTHGGGYGGYGGRAYGGVALAKGLNGGLIGHAPIGRLPAAIHSRRSYEVVPVPTVQEPAQLTQIDVDPVENPVSIRFTSKSSPVHIDQVHLPGEAGRYEETHSADEPHRLVHTVTRPVIQEVREIIQPFRKHHQEIRPVLEEINTVVARGVPRIQSFIAAPAPVVAAAPVAVAAAPILAPAPIAAPIAVAQPVAIAGPTGLALGPQGALSHGRTLTLGDAYGHY